MTSVNLSFGSIIVPIRDELQLLLSPETRTGGVESQRTKRGEDTSRVERTGNFTLLRCLDLMSIGFQLPDLSSALNTAIIFALLMSIQTSNSELWREFGSFRGNVSI